MPRKKKHPKKEIEDAIEYAEANGWRHKEWVTQLMRGADYCAP